MTAQRSTGLSLVLMLLVALALIPAAVFVGYSSAQDRTQAERGATESAERWARVAAEDPSRSIEGARQLLIVLGQLPEVRGEDAQACRERLAGFLEAYPRYTDLAVARADGTPLCRAAGDPAGLEVLSQDWFLAASSARTFVVGGYYGDAASPTGLVTFGYPVLHEDGSVLRVLFAESELNWPTAAGARDALPQGSRFLVLDRAGTVMTASPAGSLAPGTRVAHTELARAALAEGTGVARSSDPDGVTRVYAFSTAPGMRQTAAVVAVGVPIAAALADANVAFVRNLSALAVVAVLGFGGAWYVGDRFILRHLNATISASRRLREGDLSARTGIVAENTEAGALVLSFDSMAEALQRKQQELERARSEVEVLNAELESRVEHRTAELRATVNELEAFSYTVSHDLRSPLRSIDGFARLLEERNGAFDEESRALLDRIHSSTSYMGRLIDDLLELSRVNRVEMQREDIDLSAMASAVLEGFQRASPARNVQVVVAPGMKAQGDPRLVRVALENLLGNAWKFTSNNDQAVIEVGSEDRDGRPSYWVRDNGAGFDMAHAGKLFQPFSRLHRREQFEGTGIGLATVHRIVARHGGRVWVTSEPGRGTTFRFTLGGRASAQAGPPVASTDAEAPPQAGVAVARATTPRDAAARTS